MDLQATPSLRPEITLGTSRGRDENGLHWTSAEGHVRLYPATVCDVKDAAGGCLTSLLPDQALSILSISKKRKLCSSVSTCEQFAFRCSKCLMKQTIRLRFSEGSCGC
uniref:Uncharacterized protein n=1 Tax=Peronospora matthiolae TaxID=2874970 RepID=A0AAV1VL62_9STRA